MIAIDELIIGALHYDPFSQWKTNDIEKYSQYASIEQPFESEPIELISWAIKAILNSELQH